METAYEIAAYAIFSTGMVIWIAVFFMFVITLYGVLVERFARWKDITFNVILYMRHKKEFHRWLEQQPVGEYLPPGCIVGKAGEDLSRGDLVNIDKDGVARKVCPK